MIILHLAASRAGLAAWAETEQFNPQANTSQQHPFALGADELRSHLLDLGISMNPTPSAQQRNMRVTLPSIGHMPIPSKQIHTVPNPGPPEGLSHWTVETIEPTMDECVQLMKACTGDQKLGSQMLAGDDAIFWAHGLHFALRLTAAQEFVPNIERDGDQTYAKWRPVIRGNSLREFHQLAAAMPPSGRAISELDSPPDDHPDALTALQTVVGQMVDDTVRNATKDIPEIVKLQRAKARIQNEHDDLVNALTATDQSWLRGNPQRNEHLTAQVDDWRRPLDDDEYSPVRLCVQLEPPDVDNPGENDYWRISYSLQPKHDSTLLVSADRIWAGTDTQLVSEPGFSARRFLRNQIELAACISDYIQSGLEYNEPIGVLLSPRAAHHFLTNDAPALTKNGVRVMLPDQWAGNQKMRLMANVNPAQDQNNVTLTGLSAIMEFNWRAALDDTTIEADEMELLANAKVPLVRIRGRWVDATSENIKDAIQRWQARPKGNMPAWNMLNHLVDPKSDEDYEIRPNGWLNDLAEQLSDPTAVKQSPVPQTMAGELRPYQARGYNWMRWLTSWGLGACLADDMGLGKTIQTLAVILADRAEGHQDPFLVVCPTSLVSNWRREAERFAPSLNVLAHQGNSRIGNITHMAEWAQDADLILTTYGVLQRDTELLASIKWRGVVLDEAQNIKNPDTQQAKAARKIQAPCRIALTGTPVENHVGDLWSIMDFLNPGLLGTREAFRKTFLLPIRNHNDQDTNARLQAMCAPFVLRRMKNDPELELNLPDKIERRVACTLTKEQATLYGAVIKDMQQRLQHAKGIERLGLVFQATTRLKQVCNHPAQLVEHQDGAVAGRSGKLTKLLELMDEAITDGQKSLVFTQYVRMGHLLRQELEQRTDTKVPFLHGSVPARERDLMVEQFQNDDNVRILIVSVRAGGNGLNLTAASHVFHYDRWWNPAVENQATDRAFRIGQTKDVQIHKMVCTGTLEEKIDLMIEQKSQLADQLINTGDRWLANLSNQELSQVLNLSLENA